MQKLQGDRAMTEYLKILDAIAILEEALEYVRVIRKRNDVSILADPLLNGARESIYKAIGFLEDIDIEELVKEEREQ